MTFLGKNEWLGKKIKPNISYIQVINQKEQKIVTAQSVQPLQK